jgi:hypothetical protein
LIANTRATMSTRVFLPVGMLDLVPRLHSPPRVAIRGGFFLGGNRRELSRRFLRGWNSYHGVRPHYWCLTPSHVGVVCSGNGEV